MRRMATATWMTVSMAMTFVLAGQSIHAAAGLYDAEDNIMGEYVGTFGSAQAEAKVYPLGKDKTGDFKYGILLSTTSGTPKMQVRLEGKRVKKDEVEFSGKWSGKIANETLTAKAQGDGGGAFELKRTVRLSPTLGQKPPEGAVVLLPFKDGKDLTREDLKAWKNRNWAPKDGGMQVSRGGQFSVRDDFGDCKLHLEFRTPYEPQKRGQGRGNSGVYLIGRYEVQILDSFGLKPGMGDCGSIYSVRITSKNMSSPPMQWQTYDITFHAPRFDDNGTMTQKARMMVLHNGVKIHPFTEIPGHTTAAPLKGNAPKGPLYFQDHGHPVQYRNIWLVELKD